MSEKCEVPDVSYQIKKEAPEGGWGYLVCIGLAVQSVCIES